MKNLLIILIILLKILQILSINNNAIISTNNNSDGNGDDDDGHGIDQFKDAFHLHKKHQEFNNCPNQSSQFSREWIRIRNQNHIDQSSTDFVLNNNRPYYYNQTNPFPVRIVGIFVTDSELPYTLELAKPSINIAIEKAKRLYPSIRWENAVFRNGSNRCTSNFAGVFAAEEFYLRRVTVFIGPSCGLALDPVARMASHWRIPVISSGGPQSQFSNKEIFSTLTRLSFSLTNLGSFVIQIFQQFHWKHMAIILQDKTSSSLIPLIKEAIIDMFDTKTDIEVESHEISRSLAKTNLKNLLIDCAKESRVILILTTGETLRQILLAAHDLNMGNGGYVFLTVELFKHANSFGNFDWFINGDSRNEDVKHMYESLFILTVHVPMIEIYQKFANDVIKKSRNEFNTSFTMKDVNVILAGFHDSVVMYGEAVTETIQDGFDPHDGMEVTKRLWNRTFSNYLSGDIYINANGDKETDYTLEDFDPRSLRMKPIQLSDPNICDDHLPDLHCNQSSNAWPILDILAVIGIVVIFILMAIFFIYRKMRLESELTSLWWKIRWNEIIFIHNQSDRSLDTSKPLTTTTNNNNNRQAQLNKHTATAIGYNDSFTKTAPLPNKGIYKGSKVFIKHMNIKHVSINRDILIELKQLKDLAHENLIRFVGICAEDQHISILTEYCEKGNLRATIRIDWPFRYSLINDIIEGLLFIHESSLGYHGTLKSPNCVIDSRLAVKLTDIGLRTLRDLSKQNSGLPNYKSLLWTAPEHLRQRRPDLHGSPKGDIYSFSIVLQEIITRSGPFETVKVIGGDGKYSVVSLDPQFIIQQLKLGGATPYRPNVDQRECAPELIELLQQCWDENPQNRPTISTIRTQIRKLSKDYIGGSGNSFLENLLLRLEQYANDLEILVEQKTSAFFEEKRKCEELLYELLPKTVADQLKRENQVKPESFQCVTIFFSDIVQFTQIAAASTPIEIVDFLNDLYTLFDSIIASYDVYKVETVGDAYMVVSGLPIRNGNEHARQIARMSLELLDQIKKFRIKHLPNQDVRLRIGIHSGPCAAGVIGLKMPRYCLFGDTVNTASRMESHGEPNKIHTSGSSKQILDRFGSFNLTLRGDIYLKGKGIVQTYWLDNENNRLFVDRFKFLNKIETLSTSNRSTFTTTTAFQQQQQQSSAGISSTTATTNQQTTILMKQRKCESLDFIDKQEFSIIDNMMIQSGSNITGGALQQQQMEHSQQQQQTEQLKSSSLNSIPIVGVSGSDGLNTRYPAKTIDYIQSLNQQKKTIE
ncbi:guanylate cyclase c-like protein 2 [Dermatophagoides farinae]|uniref:Guanylate cyclase n=1 Tax=Dermatophagoides farinae TaxID=6954 RepID=A0A9D4P721_DERFA|nr:guanylate cyclase c-like protein 2 [Dermatophagoides farinae]